MFFFLKASFLPIKKNLKNGLAFVLMEEKRTSNSFPGSERHCQPKRLHLLTGPLLLRDAAAAQLALLIVPVIDLLSVGV